MEQERKREEAASSGEGMAIDLVVQGGQGEEEQAWDDVKGGMLDRDEVRKARTEEVEYMKRLGLWEVVSRKQAVDKRMVSVKWVDTD